MGYFPNGTVFNYSDRGELLRAAGIDPSDRYATIEAIQCEIEGECQGMKVSRLDAKLTNPAAFYRALKKAQVGDPTWQEDFQLVGSSLLDSLREAMKERCRQGAIEAQNAAMQRAFIEKERARTRAHNEAIEAKRKANNAARLAGVEA